MSLLRAMSLACVDSKGDAGNKIRAMLKRGKGCGGRGCDGRGDGGASKKQKVETPTNPHKRQKCQTDERRAPNNDAHAAKDIASGEAMEAKNAAEEPSIYPNADKQKAKEAKAAKQKATEDAQAGKENAKEEADAKQKAKDEAQAAKEKAKEEAQAAKQKTKEEAQAAKQKDKEEQ